MSIQSTTQKTPILDSKLDRTTLKKLPGPPEFTHELHMRQETEGVLLECYLIYEPDHEPTWFKEGQPLHSVEKGKSVTFNEKYQPFLERRGDWTYCALAIRHLDTTDAGNYSVSVRNQFGEKTNHVRLSMKDPNEQSKYPGGIEPSFFRKPSSRQEHDQSSSKSMIYLEAEIEALPPPRIEWSINGRPISPSCEATSTNSKYVMSQSVSAVNSNIHVAQLKINNANNEDGGNYVVKASNAMGVKECTLALNFGEASDDESCVPAKVYEQPEIIQVENKETQESGPNNNNNNCPILILEAHIHANPKPKISWLKNGDFVRESDRVKSSLDVRVVNDDKKMNNRWNARLKILNPNKSDSGDYKLSVKNKYGTDFTTWLLG